MDGDDDTGGQREPGPVERSVAGSLADTAKGTPTATIALLLAQRLDEGVEVLYGDDGPQVVQTSAQSTTALARELRMQLDKLRELYPPALTQGKVASIQAQRQKRRAR